MKITEQFIESLISLGAHDRYMLKTMPDMSRSVSTYIIFSNLWYPIVNSNGPRPTREAVWLVTQLYANYPVGSSNYSLPYQLSKCTEKIDRILSLPFNQLEQPLMWAVRLIASNRLKINWVELTDDLSQWHNRSTQTKWIKQFNNEEGNHHVN